MPSASPAAKKWSRPAAWPPSGVPAKLRRPLDFLVVTDHSNYLGLPFALKDGDPALLADPNGKKLYDGIKEGGEAGFKLFADIANSMSINKPFLDTGSLLKSTWAKYVAA